MDGFSFKLFWDTFDFEALMRFFNDGWKDFIHSKIFIGVAVLGVVLVAYNKTRDAATMVVSRGAVIIVYGVGAVVLKNSIITQPGPFMLALALALAAIGYTIWTKLLLNR
ncbi:MAG: hypothetical protein HY280_10695 [Nitrospinae bacterium]|nr:hypothetical protein [Nitrospinota bacterium]